MNLKTQCTEETQLKKKFGKLEKRSKVTFQIVAQKAEKAMAPHCSTLVWKIPGMGQPGRLQSTGLQRVGHN